MLALLVFAPAAAEPALWAIRSDRATIYLFGTIHMLHPGMDWESPRITKALGDSSDVWLELIDDDSPKLGALVMQLGFDAAHPLSSRLSSAEFAKLDAAAKALGLPGGAQAIDTMRPWQAALDLTILPVQQAGYDSTQGADQVLKRQAAAAGKKLHGLETAEKQLHFFADMPPAQENLILESTLDEIDEGPAKIDDSVKAWLAGDVADFDKLFLEFREPKYRPLYKVLLVDRNQAWAKQIASMAKTGSGTSFIAVGAGHLAGPDSLIVALERQGVTVERE
jgi:uncharacterized protein YbaP (TraB family)